MVDAALHLAFASAPPMSNSLRWHPSVTTLRAFGWLLLGGVIVLAVETAVVRRGWVRISAVAIIVGAVLLAWWLTRRARAAVRGA